jgi:hypothetical protein
MTLTANGGLALGTTTPTTSAGYTTFSTNGSTGGQIEFQTAGAGKAFIYSNLYDLRFYTSGGVFRFENTTGLEVGYLAAIGLYKLDVNGTSRFSGNMNINKTGTSSILYISNGDINTIDGTEAVFLEPQNGGKTSYFGRENSAGSWVFATPVTPYSTVIAAYNSTAPIILGHNNAEVTIANGGATTFSSSVTASSFIKSGGTSAQFLKADGSVDSNTYITSASLSGYLPLTGGTLTGDLTTSGWFINSTDTYGIKNSSNNSSFWSQSGGWVVNSNDTTSVTLAFYTQYTQQFAIGRVSEGIYIENNQGAEFSLLAYQGAGYGGYLTGTWNVTNILTVAGNYARINKDYVYDSGYIEYYSSFATTPSTKPWRAGVFSSGDVEIGTIFQIKFPNSTATQFQVFEYGQVAIGGSWLYINEGGTSNACNINFGGGTIGATNSWKIRTGSGFGGYNLLNNATTLYNVSTSGTHSFYSSTPTLLAQFSSTAATFSTTIVATNGDILGGSTTSDTGSLTLRGGYGTTAANAAKIQIRGFESGAATQGALMFFTNDTERFRISQTGAAVFFGSVGVTSNYLSVGAYGLASDTYSAYFRRNDTSNYSAWDITGAKGGYVGAFYNTPNLPHMMFSSTDGNGGLFYQTAGRWITYYHYVNNCLSINGATSSASYRLYVNGDSRIVGTFNVSTLTTNGIVYSNGGNLTNTNPSDIRLKEDISPLQYGLKEVMALNPVTYKWKDGSNGGQRSTGLIAQDVKEIMPDYVKNVSEDSDLLGLDSYAINIVLINAIKELQAEIEILKNK